VLGARLVWFAACREKGVFIELVGRLNRMNGSVEVFIGY
jgi:hypothetical protein